MTFDQQQQVPKEAKHKRDQVSCRVLTTKILQYKQRNKSITKRVRKQVRTKI